MKNLFVIALLVFITGCAEKPPVPFINGYYLTSMEPLSYLEDLKDSYDCPADTGFNCITPNKDLEKEFKSYTKRSFVLTNGEQKHNFDMRASYRWECEAQQCITKGRHTHEIYVDELIGRKDPSITTGYAGYGLIGFYINITDDGSKTGKATLHKLGTGPLADQYPMYTVYKPK